MIIISVNCICYFSYLKKMFIINSSFPLNYIKKQNKNKLENNYIVVVT